MTPLYRLVFMAGIGLVLLSVLGAMVTSLYLSPKLTLEDVTRIIASDTTPNAEEWQFLKDKAESGNPVAMNNLGVAIWRTGKRGAKAKAQGWFERAAAAGDPAARYNLALMLPDRFDTDPKIIQQRLSLLQANVEAGDIPSMVALARSLYFVNREAYVPDRLTVKRSLLERAAATGDADYLVAQGKALWDEVRGGGDPALLSQALGSLKAAWEKGDPRGAETIGFVMDHGDPAIRTVLDQSELPRDPLLWFRRAGDMGLATARCQHGLTLFRTGDWARRAEMGLIQRHFRAGPAVLKESPEVLARAIQDLDFCANDPKRSRRPNPPFGAPSLYAYKLRGTWTAMITQPGWSDVTLGILYGYGIAVERDRPRAIDHLERAHQHHDIPLASKIKAGLPGF